MDEFQKQSDFEKWCWQFHDKIYKAIASDTKHISFDVNKDIKRIPYDTAENQKLQNDGIDLYLKLNEDIPVQEKSKRKIENYCTIEMYHFDKNGIYDKFGSWPKEVASCEFISYLMVGFNQELGCQEQLAYWIKINDNIKNLIRKIHKEWIERGAHIVNNLIKNGEKYQEEYIKFENEDIEFKIFAIKNSETNGSGYSTCICIPWDFLIEKYEIPMIKLYCGPGWSSNFEIISRYNQ